ncbi:MAG: Beta-galactosidase [Fimbriimonadaceae bacterium]|nr:Beta-galactosidase [Fimbriimonadaceae bacterium]
MALVGPGRVDLAGRIRSSWRKLRAVIRALLPFVGCILPLAASFPAPAQTLKTRWAERVTAANAHREYPRPLLARKDWVNLNGHWDLTMKGSTQKILVPFPVESQLSGVAKRVEPGDTLRYRRTFTRPKGDRVWLHFGAVDWHARVLVNGNKVGEHKGGYDPFSFDITDALTKSGRQQLEVIVTDPTDTGPQPRGKQVLKPEGIWYVPTSGIWQTVWLEAVPNHSIAGLDVRAKNDGTLTISIDARTAPGSPKARSFFTVELRDGKRAIKAQAVAGGKATLKVPKPRLWAPDSPTLYPIKVKWMDDVVESYVAFREITLKKDKDGQPRVHLNGKPIFLIGPLDQGFWPDGLYTPPSDEAMKYDLDVTKRLGFNMIRKHVKVESARWYSWCDRLGILVMQDMPSGDKYIGGRDPDITRTPESAAIFQRELKGMIDAFRNHPCIISWVPFNEGWGQWETAKVASWIKTYDPTRLVNSASGWTDRKVGDFWDWHVYPGPGSPPNDPKRALFLGEFGGLGLPMPGHMWKESGWGYQSFKTQKELTDRFVVLLDELRYLIDKPGLSGAVYTQTTDVEVEVNGLMTYDRAVIKMDEKRVRDAVRKLHLPPPVMKVLVPTSETVGQNWQYTLAKPETDWQTAAALTSAWRTGPGGFGTPETPGAIVRTRWDTKDIWLRRQFKVGDQSPTHLRIHHDDDVEVYIDGKLVYKAPGWTSSYRNFPIEGLAKGEHTLAIYCHQNSGGQYIDAGFVRLTERAR